MVDLKRLIGLCIAALGVAAPALADTPLHDPLARATTRLGPGYVIHLTVTINLQEEKELCGPFTLDAEGRVPLTVGFRPIDPVALKGCTAGEAEKRVAAALDKYYTSPPQVRISIARIPRFRVMVEGATFRNGPLTLPDGARLSDALSECGYQPSADLHSVRIHRLEKDGARVTLKADFQQILETGVDDPRGDPALQEGDRIEIPIGPILTPRQTIAVHGEVRRPGFYDHKPGMTVNDALMEAMGVTASADPSRVTICRRRDNSFLTVDADKVKALIPTDNVALQPGDVVYVATKDSGKRYAVTGAVPAPATFDHPGKVMLTEAITQAGGLRPSADRAHIVLVKGMLSDPAHARNIPIRFDLIASGKAPDVPIDPGDMVQVPEKKRASINLLDIGSLLFRWFLF